MPKSLPLHASLEHLRKEAKHLLATARRGDRSVLPLVRRLKRFHGRPEEAVLAAMAANLSLQEIQHGLAIEYGFRDWVELIGHVQAGADPEGGSPSAQEVFAGLGEAGAFKEEPHRWNDAMAAYRPGSLPFLDTARLPDKCRAAGIALERVSPLSALAEEIAQDRHLRAFAWYMHWRVAVACEFIRDDLPSLRPRLGRRAGLFWLLLALEIPGRLAESYRSLGFPGEALAETARSIADDEAMHLAGEGVSGIYARDYRGYFELAIPANPHVRLGRFEYGLRAEWGEYYYVFRRNIDGAVIALFGGGLRIGEDGLMLAEDAPPSAGWKTTWTKTDDTITANPVHPDGRVLKRTVRLSRSEWRQVPAMTGPGEFDSEARLDVHVPYGGRMEPDAVRESFRKADAFFRERFPARPVRILTMRSWFLDPRVPEILGTSSNAARFQRGCYLVPDDPSSSLLRLVFQRDVDTTPVDELPVRTSMQRAIVAFLKGGGVWHGGGMFILSEDLPGLREGFYPDRFAALSQELGLNEPA